MFAGLIKRSKAGVFALRDMCFHPIHHWTCIGTCALQESIQRCIGQEHIPLREDLTFPKNILYVIEILLVTFEPSVQFSISL
jgi:hypothetical protein